MRKNWEFMSPEEFEEELRNAGRSEPDATNEPAPSPSLPPGSPSGVVEALRQIAEAESDMCGRCDGEGRVWADGKAHHQGYSGPLMACPDCGGAGKKDAVDLREIARLALASLPQAPATPAAAPADAGAKRREDLWIVFSDHLFKPSIFQTAADGHAFLRKHKRGGTMHRYKRVSEGSSRVEGQP